MKCTVSEQRISKSRSDIIFFTDSIRKFSAVEDVTAHTHTRTLEVILLERLHDLSVQQQ